jgi:hypothetical protein
MMLATILLIVGLGASTVHAQAQAGRDTYTRGSVGFGCYAARPTSQDNTTPYYQTGNAASAQGCSVRDLYHSAQAPVIGCVGLTIRTTALSNDHKMPTPRSSTIGKAAVRPAGAATFTNVRSSSLPVTTPATPARVTLARSGRMAVSRPPLPPMARSVGHERRRPVWPIALSLLGRKSGRSAV